MIHYFVHRLRVCLWLLPLCSLLCCRTLQVRRQQQRQQRTEADSSFSLSAYAYSRSHLETNDSIIAEALLWPEGTFHYQVNDGYTGKASRLQIRYRQQQRQWQQDSIALHNDRQGASHHRQQSAIQASEKRQLSLPYGLVVASLLLLLLLALYGPLRRRS